MLTVTLEFDGTFNSQVADVEQGVVMLSMAVLPLTTAFLPTNDSAWVDCAVCCSDTSVLSESLVLSCSWTPANSTSCWVNWLVSSGLRGSWFSSCVVNSVRNCWKLPAICWLARELADAADAEEECVGSGG